MQDIFKIKFPKDKDAEFVKELKQRVNGYFKEKGISRHANFSMITKTVSMFAMLLVPYFAMMFFFTNFWLVALCWLVIGLGVAGIGMSVMHDANHGAYSKHKWVNRMLGRVLDVVGGNATNWKIQHNLLHHTFTNVEGLDTDIEAGALLRLHKEQKWIGLHKFQYIYAWFLYGFMTLRWMTVKDFVQPFKFRKNKVNGSVKRSFWSEYTIMIAIKAFYYTYMYVLPMIFLPFAWWQVLIFFFIMQFTTGVTLATTFQLAHVVPDTTFHAPAEDNSMEENWVVHQLKTTSDFARNNWLVSWYIGGLNFQVEHHLFPNICHIHYKKLSKIVEETAKEYGIVYHNMPSMWSALIEHGKQLKALGSKDYALG